MVFRLTLCAILALVIDTRSAAAQGELFLEASGEYSPVRIADAETSWHLGRVSGGWLDEGRSGWLARSERHQRGRVTDWTMGLSGFRRRGDWTVSGSAGITGHPDFLYRYSLEGEIARRVVGTVVVHGAYRHLAFSQVDVRIAQPGVSVHFPVGEVQGRVFLVRNLTLERTSAAFLLQGRAAIRPRVTLGGGAALGTRIFDIAALSAPGAEGWVLFGYARFALAPTWNVDVGVGRAHEDPFFSQRTLSFAVRRTFQ